MSASASLQHASLAGEESAAISAMAFVSDSVAMGRISADLFQLTLGKAEIRDGTIDTALAMSDWPRDLDLLIVDLGASSDPVADAATLKTAVPGSCIVIGVGASTMLRSIATFWPWVSTTTWPFRWPKARRDVPSSAHWRRGITGLPLAPRKRPPGRERWR